MSTQVILLERVEKLGNMGEVVNVKPGYARNYLLPQKKALRASKDNIAYFESQKKTLEADNDKRKAEAQKFAKKLEGLTVALIRQASEGGQLYGSVAARDIAEQAAATSGEAIDRSMIILNQNYKLIGLFPVEVTLHPEVKVEITVNIARSPEEAEIQASTGKALTSDASNDEPEEVEAPDADALEAVLEDDALEAEKGRQADAEEKAAEDAVKEEEREVKRAEKAEAKAAAEAAVAENEEGAEDAAPEEEAKTEDA
jgi:large subunit ribosomal protein L9